MADFQGLFVFFEFFDKLSDFSAFTSFSINQPVADFQGLFVFFEFFDKLSAMVMYLLSLHQLNRHFYAVTIFFKFPSCIMGVYKKFTSYSQTVWFSDIS